MVEWHLVVPKDDLHDTGGHIAGAYGEGARVVDRIHAIKVAHELDCATIEEHAAVREEGGTGRAAGDGILDSQGGGAGHGHRVAGVIDNQWRVIVILKNQGRSVGPIADGQRRALRAAAAAVIEDGIGKATRAAEESGIGAGDFDNPAGEIV